jgi:hypothetical protein
MGRPPTRPLDEAAGTRERWDETAVVNGGVAAAVIEVQVSVDIPTFAANAGAERLARRRPAPSIAMAPGARVGFVPTPVFRRTGLAAGTDEQELCDRDAVLFIEVGAKRSYYDPGDEFEGGTGVLTNDAIADDKESELAEAEPVAHPR